MSDDQNKVLKITSSDFTVDENGKVLIENPELAETLQSALENGAIDGEDGMITINVACACIEV